MTDDGFDRSLDDRIREFEASLEEVSYELSDARHRGLRDPVATIAALDRAIRHLTQARALVAAQNASQ